MSRKKDGEQVAALHPEVEPAPRVGYRDPGVDDACHVPITLEPD